MFNVFSFLSVNVRLDIRNKNRFTGLYKLKTIVFPEHFPNEAILMGNNFFFRLLVLVYPINAENIDITANKKNANQN